MTEITSPGLAKPQAASDLPIGSGGGAKKGSLDGREFEGSLAQAGAAMQAAALVQQQSQGQASPLQQAQLPAEMAQAGSSGEVPQGNAAVSGQLSGHPSSGAKGAAAAVQAVGTQAAIPANAQGAVAPGKAQQQPKAQPMQRTQPQPAASLNTGAAIAGLQPWSREWVFEGKAAQADLRPLIPGKEPLAAEAASAEQGTEIPSFMHPAVGAERLAKAAPETGAMRSDAEQATQAQARDASAAGMGGQLGAMGGEILSYAVASHGAQAGKAAQSGTTPTRDGQSPIKKAMPAYGSLSGADFLEARSNAIRGTDSGHLKVIEGGAQDRGGMAAGENPFQSSIESRLEKGALKSKIASTHPASAALGQELTPAAGFGTTLAGVTTAGAGATHAQHRAELAGQVIPGAMAQNRLSTASLQGIGTQIRGFSQHGGGEIRVRLKPEHLGELHLRVMTNGKDVALQIQATDEQAKKVIEESLGGLKDSLAGQSLSLGKVDISVAQSGQTAAGGDFSQQNGSQSQEAALGGWNGQGSGQGNRGEQGSFADLGRDGEFAPRRQGGLSQASAAASAAAARASAGRSSSSRVDVMA